MRRKKRRIARIAAYATAALIVFTGFARQNNMAAENYRTQLTDGCRRAFSEMAANARDLDAALEKTMCAGSGTMRAELLGEARAWAAAGAAALGNLPVASGEAQKVAAFLWKTGECARALAEKSAAGDELSDGEYLLLAGFCKMSSALRGPAAAVKPAAEETRPDAGGGTPPQRRGNAGAGLSGRLGTPGLDDARGAASAFWGFLRDDVEYVGEIDGKIPCYRFTVTKDGAARTADVTKSGAKVLAARTSRRVASGVMAPEAGLKIARRFLENHGYPGARTVSWETRDNAVTADFAAATDGVVCYPDLLRVSVALDNGEIIAFDAAGYIANHKERKIPKAKVTEEEAAARLSPRLRPVAHQMAVVTASGEEALCHEFVCERPGGGRCIVCLNAGTGAEERILLLYENENGTTLR